MRLKIEGIHKTYATDGRAVAALVDVNLQLAAGEFTALCGKSGCGKSSLLLTAGGLLRPDAGRVLIDDFDLYEMSPNARAEFRAEKIGFVFQQFHLIPYLTVEENVLAASLGEDKVDRTKSSERAKELIERLDLVDRASHRPGQLSTGERQRTALARALLNEPVLLLADEPTGNLDHQNTAIVLEYLEQFASGGGSVLLATHDAQAAARAGRQCHMDRGRMVDQAEGAVQ